MSMPRSTDTILDRTRTREVTAVFHSRRALDDAAQDLLLSGFDRSDIDISASPDEVQRRLNYAVIPPADLADTPTAPRQPFFGADDLLGVEAVASSVLGCIAAVGSALFLIIKGYEAMAVAMWSILIGIFTGAVVIVPIYRLLRRERVRGLEPAAEWDGLLIWVRVRAPEKEAQAQEILMRHGGQAVHVHEIDLEKRPEDLPLHSLRPDPWLGDERLGRP
ncbi:hypothetical protein [Bradyrhizobium manausense]|jgi:hypothetical protein|uniref:Uncharacterized protein n=1 Tax=Bradyrhizobium manausense TaxID=989370 RepID=A0A0R3DY90_9BRAD|nr:hypothetical protein [Bradyrhizobium manausense]KRQ14883.1 hypothetical protein AOQ71_10675 [Bradyrhizobium manausense]